MNRQELTEAEVQQVLSRAAQLDATASDRLHVDQVRAIAAELGISSSALDKALAEHAASTTPATRPSAGVSTTATPARWWRRHRVAMLIAAIVLALTVGIGVSRTLVPRDQPSVDIMIGP